MSDAQASVEGLRARFIELGYCVRDNGFFEPGGLAVFQAPPSAKAGEIQLPERIAYIYRKAGSFEVRVTKHGGPHCVRRSEMAHDVETFALEVLRSSELRWPPSGDWTEAE